MKKALSPELKVKSQKEGVVADKSVTVRARFLKISPTKLNLVAKMVRRRSLPSSLSYASFSQTKAAKLLTKLLKSGQAVAEAKGLNKDKLFVSQLLVGSGPSLKRGRPVARGSYHPIRKRTSHLVLTLQEIYGSKS